MPRNIKPLLEFPRKDAFFKSMQDNAPEVLLNIEIIFSNFLDLLKSYHHPKQFILQSNNLARGLCATMDFAYKKGNKYQWFNDGIKRFQENNIHNFGILKEIRRISLHTEFIIPDGAITFGLYRIQNQISYKQKIGMGDIRQSNNLPMKYLFSDTSQIFHKLLMLHYLVYIDIEHSSVNECLGITRRWNYRIKTNKIDLFEFLSRFCQNLIDSIIHSFANNQSMKPKYIPFYVPDEYNYINTLLEIDLYPNLFQKWWQSKCEPLNWEYLLDYYAKITIDKRHTGIESLYNSLPKSIGQYLTLLKRYKDIRIEDFKNQEDYNLYCNFILMHHWFIKCIDVSVILANRRIINILFDLHEMAEKYMMEVDSIFDCIPIKEKNEYLANIGDCLKELHGLFMKVERPAADGGSDKLS